MIFPQLSKKDILILGLGREGESSLKFIRKLLPQKRIGLADKLIFEKLPPKAQLLIKRDKNLSLHLGKNYLRAIKRYDIIIKTPGIPKKSLTPFLKNGQIITSQSEIFLEKYAPITIGVTGTKGKSTTASLIYKILKTGGIKTVLLGNIGRPCLDYFKSKKPADFFVFEISSHQLQDLKISPHIAIFLNIFREHLDYYKNFSDYFSAKKNIGIWQKKNDFFIFNADLDYLKNFSKKIKSNLFSYGLKNKGLKKCYFKNGWILFENKKIIRKKEIPLYGDHNLFNAMAAISAGMILKIDPLKIKRAIKEFKPLKHRMEYVKKFGDIEFINDSLSTVPQATISAIGAVSNIETIILGGFDRGQYFKDLVEEISRRKIKNLILFPDTGKRIFLDLKKHAKYMPRCFFVSNMKDAVKIAFKEGRKGVCILSPASASFNLFKDYKDRGEQFKKYVKIFAKNKY